MSVKLLPLAAWALIMVVSASKSSSQTTRKAYRGDSLTRGQLELAFDQLQSYLWRELDVKDPEGLKAAKRATNRPPLASFLFGKSLLQTAAKIYVYLNEFEVCNLKALDYMDDVLRARPRLEPGRKQADDHHHHHHHHWFGLWQPTSRLDILLESTLLRCSHKCSSFFEKWIQVSKQSFDTENVAKKLKIFLKGGQANCATSELNLQSQNLKELQLICANYVQENLLNPCKVYLESVSRVMEAATRFILGAPTKMSSLLEAPSEYFRQAQRRYNTCKSVLIYSKAFVEGYTKEALRRVASIETSLQQSPS